MDIRWVEVEEPDTGRVQLYMTVDEGVFIHVDGKGELDMKWKVRAAHGEGAVKISALVTSMLGSQDAQGWHRGLETLGTAAIWANPMTLAHQVMDVINNQ
jgi:hypothetical protein